MEPALLAVSTVLFLASVIRSLLGFGEALIAVPLVAMVVPVQVDAKPLVLNSVRPSAAGVQARGCGRSKR